MLIFITGPSASGKSTLRDWYCKKHSLAMICAYTTRPKRSGESEIHKFVPEKEFIKMFDQGRLCLVANNHGYRYGYPVERIINDNSLKVFEVDSATAIQEKEILQATIVRVIPANKYSALIKILLKRDGIINRIMDLFFQTNKKFIHKRELAGDIIFKNTYSPNDFDKFNILINSLKRFQAK